MSDTPFEPTGSGNDASQGDAATSATQRSNSQGRAPRSASSPDAIDGPSDNSQPEGSSQESSEGGDPAKKRRRRGSRGGRNRSAASRAAARAAREAEGIESTEQSSDNSQPDTSSPNTSQSRATASRGESSSAQSTSTDSTKVESTAGESASNGTPARNAGGARRNNSGNKPRVGDSRQIAEVATSGETTTQTAEANASANKQRGDNSQNQNSDGSTPARKRRRRGGRKRGAKRTDDATSSAILNDEPIELDSETLKKRRGKERNGRPLGRYLMCVQRRGDATQIAVLEGRNLIEHYVSRPNDDVNQIDGNIYLSAVQNVLPGMEAAFIDIGTPKNAVLYRGDIRRDDDGADFEGRQGDSNKRIEELLKAGQTIVTQVTKNPIGAKGARLTQEVSLPGRFVVLMPNSSTYGISKRLPDNERKRLRGILDSVKPKEHGIILRTAAEGATADELRRDVARLVRQWSQIEDSVKNAKAPKLVYREPDMAVRIIREEFNKDYRGVIIDDRELFEEVRDYVASISPELADRIECFDRESEDLPLFERYHVHEQVHKALDRKVWLPSGGSLIIERTEALTVIDVNTGKNVGKSNLEETVYKNNLEAAEEIARQLRLRDVGGIIVIDFIDMEIKKNRDDVLSRLREALARDKTRTQAYPIGELGLVEMTRKRISEGLVESFSSLCPECSGRGFVLDSALLTSD